MAILDRLGLPAPDWRALDRDAQLAKRLGRAYRKPVRDVLGEIERIKSLPRRPPVDLASARGEALVELMTARLRRPDARKCACRERWGRCIDRLLPAQAWTLYEAPLAGGIFGRMGAGSGKTICDILTPIVMRPRLAVLFVPPGLTEQLWVEYQRVAEHFLVPSLIFQDGSCDRGRFIVGAPPLHVVPYSILQRPERTTLLRGLDPDLIIADEGHYLRNVAGSARGSRLLDHMVEKPDTGFCVWSGTLVAKSIRDFAHLLAFALGDQSPLPQHPEAVAELAQAVDPSNFGGTPDPGALAALMAPGEDAREAVRRRVSETLGVIETRASACDASIYILERKPPPMPEHLAEFLSEFRRTQVLHMDEDDEDVADPLQVARICQQVACGFYYKWIFPRGEPEELILEWYAARKEWHRELREKLKQPSPHLDSPFLCASAAARFYRGRDERGRVVERGASCDACEGSGRVKCVCAGGLGAHMPPMSVGAMLGSALDDDLDPVAETCRRCTGDGEVSCGVCGGGGGGVYKGSLPTWAAESWPRWVAVRDLVYHETKAVWLDDYLARDAADWGLSERGVVWYEHDAFGRKVSEVSGLPLHGGGPGAEARILAERGDRSIVASIRAHGTGRDGLQRIFMGKQLIANPPPSADRFEQLLARYHRIGFVGDSVEARVYRHTPEMREAIDKAVRLAKFVQGISGNLQKLLIANCDFIVKS